MNETALEILHNQDSFAAIDYVTKQGDALAVVEMLDALMRDLYWKAKNLTASIAMGRAGVQHALAAAGRLSSENPEMSLHLRGKAKALCYNLASFTWSGWAEPGIRVTASDEALGLDAARANLRLGRELSRGDLPLSRAHWMLGAHQLAARDHPSAIESFRLAVSHAETAGALPEAFLGAAFLHLVEYLANPLDASARAKLDAARGELLSEKDGESFVKQIDTALRIFGNGTTSPDTPATAMSRSV